MNCVSCWQPTQRRGPFGEALCAPCHQDEDDAIEQAERRTARRLGTNYGWSEDNKTPTTPQARPLSE